MILMKKRKAEERGKIKKRAFFPQTHKYRGIGENRPEVALVSNAKGQVGKKFVWQKIALLNKLTE